MSNIPFSVYDFFAYLSSGSVVLAAVDLIYGKSWLLQKDHTLVFSLFLVLVAYITGHVVAQFSSFLIEQLLVARVLLRPSEALMGKQRPVLRWLFPLYYTPLTDRTQARVNQRAAERGFSGTGEALFVHAFSVVKQHEKLRERLDNFRNLYGFSRNMAFAFLAVTATVLIGPTDERSHIPRGWALAFFGVAVTMLFRYLKFFRQYSYELFITYAEIDPTSRGSES